MAQMVRLAIEGCGHGTLHAIYEAVGKQCDAKGWPDVDALIIGGDFQAVRNSLDLNCMAVPIKYRELGDFHEYYSGTKKAPYLTIFVGGNHEASNHLWELYHGGWAAPNIYYLGASNVLRLGPLRIAGFSGIWKGYNYRKPHHERLPYSQDDIRSIYHVRELEVRKLQQIKTQVDVGLSHDWPNGVEWLGNYKWLFKKKDLFEADARQNKLGSVAAQKVLDHLRPTYWFSAHLHIKYTATINHQKHDEHKQIPNGSSCHAVGEVASSSAIEDGPEQIEEEAVVKNEEELDLNLDDQAEPSSTSNAHNQDEIDLDIEDNTVDNVPPSKVDEVETNETVHSTPQQPSSSITEQSTSVSEDLRAQLPASFAKSSPTEHAQDLPTSIFNTTTGFLALDKCLPGRYFLELLEVMPISDQPSPIVASVAHNSQRPFKLCYDPEWLSIVRAFSLEHPLSLGDPAARVPHDLGKAGYLSKIQTAQEWVQTHITSEPEKLIVPENFTITAPVYDAQQRPGPHEMPPEYNNPQTQAYCDLLGVENRFWSTDEERAERVARGPAPSEDRGGRRGGHGGRNGGGRGGRGRGSHRGRGFRGRR